MKSTLLALSLITFSIAAQAKPIQVETAEKTFKTFSSILASDVITAENRLRVYMEDAMSCSKVRLNLNIIKEDRVFSHGLFNLFLTADCDNSLSNFRLDFDPLCGTEGEASLSLQYSKSGQTIFKRIIVENSESCSE